MSELIDTSNMSKEERAALEMAEAARDSQELKSYVAGLMQGEPDFSKIKDFPQQSKKDQTEGNKFIKKLENFLTSKVDADAIDAEGEIPDAIIKELAKLGAFGIKIDKKYKGLGLSQTNYSRSAMKLGSNCANLTALLSAHQSIGIPQPLIIFGNEEQKKKYLPRVAKGEISAFALTEKEVGSDPARMSTTAELSPDKKHYILNGEKLWCTNLLKAGVIIVMAKTPTKYKPNSTSAFIVEMDTPGVKVVRRCHFMGLRALYNGVVTFKNVKIPCENLIGKEGQGLKIALTTLNTGRITLPAACTGMAQRCLEIATSWAKERVQWGVPIGKHSAIADKLSQMSADTFAMESLVLYVSALVDKDKKADIRLESAMAKLWGSETSWRIIYDTMQIRGGRGYETAQSLKARGESPGPVERFFRDARINTIFEGSSEIMRLLIAREALDPHLRIGAPIFNSKLPSSVRAKFAIKAGIFYTIWFAKKCLPFSLLSGWGLGNYHPKLKKEMSRVNFISKKLARKIFWGMLKFGPKMQYQQLFLGRVVDIATLLFTISATCSRAQKLLDEAKKKNATKKMSAEAEEKLNLTLFFAQKSRQEITKLFSDLKSYPDKDSYKTAKNIL